MPICNQHNLSRPVTDRPFGIRMTLPAGDPMARMLGAHWEAFRWYATEYERDQALEQIRGRHRYSRPGDYAACVCEKVTRDPAA